ncbi:hypothetical protein [Planctomycetes bacterium Pan216]|uniref:hypothetical protein n=1 Tax=Kolteria novifilia TaxID=2527975 RepID=UPI00119FC3D2
MGHGTELSPDISRGLGLYFLVLGLLNAYYCVRLWTDKGFQEKWKGANEPVSKVRLAAFPLVWSLLTTYMLGTSIEFFNGVGPVLSEAFRDWMDRLMGPVNYFVISTAAFIALIVFRRIFAKNVTGWVLLNGSLLFIGISMTDPDFRGIVAKPDNVPITMLIYSVGFTTWLALRQAVINDDRIKEGKKPLEAEGAEKVLTWPDLVYTEMLAMVLCTVFLLVWSICLKAPLEPPASTTKIPNPSKAPWYFLGLQEMLVYFDPWLAGVVLPTYIIIGLCAMPYIDYNKKGNGYYTFAERPFAIITFLFGFLVLWVVLIVLGTFLRGPNWNFFGFYEVWDPDKTVALNNIDLSDLLYLDLLNTGKPSNILAREWLGILLVLSYFLITPFIMAKTFMKEMFIRMGLIRFLVMTNIFLMMAFLPIKMVLRWAFNLKYIIAIPEMFLNV